LRRALVILLGLLVFLTIHHLKRLYGPQATSGAQTGAVTEGLTTEGLAALAPHLLAFRAPASLGEALPESGPAAAAEPVFPNFLQLIELVSMLRASPGRLDGHYKRSRDHLAEFEREWLKRFRHQPNVPGSASETEELVRLCGRHLLSACEYFRRNQVRVLEEYRGLLREMPESDARDRAEARTMFIASQLMAFDDFLCREGLALNCSRPLHEVKNEEIAEIVTAFCLDGNPEYCREAGEELRDRFGQSRYEAMTDEEKASFKRQARDLTVRACEGGEFWSCYDLLQAPLWDPRDLRSAHAMERLAGLCGQGRDPSACVAVAVVKAGGARSEVAVAVRDYCAARSSSSRDDMTENEESLCGRVAATESVSDELWRDIGEHVYHGEQFGGSVLAQLLPPDDKRVQIRLVSGAAP